MYTLIEPLFTSKTVITTPATMDYDRSLGPTNLSGVSYRTSHGVCPDCVQVSQGIDSLSSLAGQAGCGRGGAPVYQQALLPLCCKKMVTFYIYQDVKNFANFAENNLYSLFQCFSLPACNVSLHNINAFLENLDFQALKIVLSLFYIILFNFQRSPVGFILEIRKEKIRELEYWPHMTQLAR